MQSKNSGTATDSSTEHRRNVLIVTGIFPPDIGGPASYVPKIASELVSRGWEVTVITLSDDLNQDDSSYSFCVIRLLRSQSKLLRIPRTIRKILQQAKNADVLFANGLFLESVVAAKLRRKPLVMKVVSDWAWERSVNRGWIDDTVPQFQERYYTLRVEILKKLRAILTRSADIVFTPSHYLRRIVTGWGVPRHHTKVIYNAVSLSSNASQPVELPSFEGTTLITVGRLIALKGVDRIIRVVSSQPDIRLIIVGDGPEMDSLQQLSKHLNLNGRTIFTGWVHSTMVIQYLRASDLFILNSDVEGLPFVVLETMAAGIPVIATDVGGTSEIIQHEVNGLLIPPRDDKALRSAICRLVQNPDERKRFLNAGYQTISANFQWNRLVESTEALLRSLVSITIP